MIVRETDDAFILIPQHEHALFSGELAKHFADHYFVDSSFYEDVVEAIAEHDRGWIRLDDMPFWNDRNGAPFSFMDYPLLPKLTHYTLGIDELEGRNAYGALLCSMHYSSFMAGAGAEQPEIVRFLESERKRRERIEDRLAMPDAETVHRHFGLLQLCDDLSLYVCMNEPGVSKADEHPWYRDGFGKSEALMPDGQRKLTARWTGESEIRMDPMPFREGFTARLRQKRVSKDRIREAGLQEAYRRTEWVEQEVTFYG